MSACRYIIEAKLPNNKCVWISVDEYNNREVEELNVYTSHNKIFKFSRAYKDAKAAGESPLTCIKRSDIMCLGRLKDREKGRKGRK